MILKISKQKVNCCTYEKRQCATDTIWSTLCTLWMVVKIMTFCVFSCSFCFSSLCFVKFIRLHLVGKHTYCKKIFFEKSIISTYGAFFFKKIWWIVSLLLLNLHYKRYVFMSVRCPWEILKSWKRQLQIDIPLPYSATGWVSTRKLVSPHRAAMIRKITDQLGLRETGMYIVHFFLTFPTQNQD